MARMITQKILDNRRQYGRCMWAFTQTFEDATNINIDKLHACWQGVWSTGDLGYTHVMNKVDNHFYMAVAIPTWDYLWYVQRYIDELIDLFSPHFEVIYTPENIPAYINKRDRVVYEKENTVMNEYGKYVKGKDYVVDHMIGRCVIKIRKAEDEPQQLYHAFLSYIRHVWEHPSVFPVQEKPPSLREMWIAAVRSLTPTSKIWSGRAHSNFTSSTYASKTIGITAEDYVNGKIELIKNKLWPDIDAVEKWHITNPCNVSPNVKEELLKEVIKSKEINSNIILSSNDEFDPWRD